MSGAINSYNMRVTALAKVSPTKHMCYTVCGVDELLLIADVTGVVVEGQGSCPCGTITFTT